MMWSKMKILLCRISKDEINQEELKQFKSLDKYLKYKWDQQERKIKETFDIDRFDHSFYDSGSAFKLEEFRKRTEFHKLLKLIQLRDV